VNDRSFEASIKQALGATVPDALPVTLEQRVRAIPQTRPARLGWWRSPQRLSVALVAVVALVVVASSAVSLLRPSSDTGGPKNPVNLTTSFGSLVASDVALLIDGRRILIPPSDDPRVERATFTGTSTFGQLTVVWRDDTRSYVLVLHLAADARTWWVSDVLASDGRTDAGGWLYFQGPLLETPRGGRFVGTPSLQTARSTYGERGLLQFGRLELSAFNGTTARDPALGLMPTSGIIGPDGPDFIPVADRPNVFVSTRWWDDNPMIGFRPQSPEIPLFGPDLKTLVGWLGPVGGSTSPSIAPSLAPSTSEPTPSPGMSPGESRSLPLRAPETGSYGRPWSMNGRIVWYDVLRLDAGPGHCGWEDITFLRMSKNLGEPMLMSDDAFEYVRDPQNRWAKEPTPPEQSMTLGRFEPSVPKPADAVFTGYVYFDGMELWRSEAVGTDFVFLRRGDILEQWPRSRSPIACA
jgi:hypothetical protein